MQYKLICIDMDGTLLNSRHKVSEASKTAIKKAHEMGVHIVISTGRMYTDAAYFSELIGVKSPVIASNGALIKEKDKDDIIYKSVMESSVTFEILDILAEYDLRPIFYTPEKAYFGSFADKLFFEYARLTGIISKSADLIYVKSIKQWHDIFEKEESNIIKCELMYRDIHRIRNIRDKLLKNDEIELSSSSKYNIEINCKGVSKGKAVEVLADYLNIKRNEIIAIGDSENDLSMIAYAGMGVAMGNAIDQVKLKAKFVTDTNDNDGVAKAINELILIPNKNG